MLEASCEQAVSMEVWRCGVSDKLRCIVSNVSVVLAVGGFEA